MNAEEIQRVNQKLVRHMLPESWQLKFNDSDDTIEIIAFKRNPLSPVAPERGIVTLEKTDPAYKIFKQLINSIKRDAFGASDIYLTGHKNINKTGYKK